MYRSDLVGPRVLSALFTPTSQGSEVDEEVISFRSRMSSTLWEDMDTAKSTTLIVYAGVSMRREPFGRYTCGTKRWNGIEEQIRGFSLT